MQITKLTDKKLNKKKYLENRIFVAADFETLESSTKHNVYAIGYKYKWGSQEYMDSIYLNLTTRSLDIDLDSNLLIKTFIDKLLSIHSKNKIIVYFHNFSGFDSYFIIDCINNFFSANKKKIIIRDNKVYRIELENIIFLCTYLILPYKLDYIAKKWLNSTKKDFDITSIKTLRDVEIYYKEIDEYLKQDVNILFDILELLISKFIDIFGIDITYYYTISSISLAYYRKNYLLEEYDLTTTPFYMEEFIRLGYYGGLCHLHKSQSDKDLYWYDVNSLYPSIMNTCDMPLGKGKYILMHKDSTLTDISDFFGFISCDIYVPEHLKIPPLPFKDYKSKSDITAQATGYLKGVWFSEELKNAISLGCQILKIYKVLHYEKKGIIFNNFIDDLYSKRINSDNNIDNMLYKSIMNSLYGRFGLRKQKSLSQWFPSETFLQNNTYYTSVIKEYGKKNEIMNYQLDDDETSSNKSINLSSERKKEILSLHYKEKRKHKYYIVSVQISAAISSYARIKLIKDMYRHMNENNALIYYYDTDSIFTDKKLNNNMVDDSKLGHYKLVSIAKKALFISPKIYCLFDEKKRVITKFKGLNKKDVLTYRQYYSFLKKGYIHTSKEGNMNKKINTFTISSIIVNRDYNFDSKKYIKVYDSNDIFIETKPIFIKKEYWDD